MGLETVIDIGAHKGEFASSILKIKKIKNIFCFEPQIKINDILVKKFSHIKKIKIFNCALDKVISKKYIYINKLTSCSTLQAFNKNSFYLTRDPSWTNKELEKSLLSKNSSSLSNFYC